MRPRRTSPASALTRSLSASSIAHPPWLRRHDRENGRGVNLRRSEPHAYQHDVGRTRYEEAQGQRELRSSAEGVEARIHWPKASGDSRPGVPGILFFGIYL